GGEPVAQDGQVVPRAEVVHRGEALDARAVRFSYGGYAGKDVREAAEGGLEELGVRRRSRGPSVFVGDDHQGSAALCRGVQQHGRPSAFQDLGAHRRPPGGVSRAGRPYGVRPGGRR
ncbi:unnamed protein product, partial [Ectocarpus sp. 8 AP-2014]